ncbi:DsbA family oxidoreductase [Bacillus andreraoultii]|uniref:DsbA family oxidoreductase n=1 Tax=Bacillus andreraoultii TaxID=1499685 RepID=UPI00053B615B|nr:DsbA family oxidoreductase [Bacillus andreraoultii]
MKIEVWSDFVCPFCYIGKRRLEMALEQFPHRDQVEVIFKSFELDPNVETDYSVTIDEAIARKYGISLEQARQSNESIINQAASVGLNYDFSQMTPTNTFRAHRLAKYAEKQGKLMEMTERLLKAHFENGERIDEVDTLVQIAGEVGFEQSDVQKVLESNQFTNEVRNDETEAQLLGVQGVPFFVINRKYAISGAQPLEVFVSALQKVWEEEHGTTQLQSFGTDEVANCTADGCAIPEKDNN